MYEQEYLIQTYDECLNNYLSHSGVKGMNWYQHKFGNWERHAKYANGQPNPETFPDTNSIKVPMSNKAAKEAIFGTNNTKNDKQYDLRKLNKKKFSELSEDEKDYIRKLNNKNYLIDSVVKTALGIVSRNPVLAADGISRITRGPSAYKKEKENEERISKSKIDKETGLHLKKYKLNPDEDMKRVNPGFYNYDSNTKNNCMLCTTAYDMRRRGYDVAANKVSLGYSSNDIKKWYPKAKIETFDAYKSIQNSSDSKLKKFGQKALLIYGIRSPITKSVKEAILKQGEGARGNMMVQFASGWGGHSVVYEVNKGKVVIRDCQIGVKSINTDSFINDCSKVQIARLDNIDFNPKTIKTAVH